MLKNKFKIQTKKTDEGYLYVILVLNLFDICDLYLGICTEGEI